MTKDLMKPKDLCGLNGCYTPVKTKRRKYCSKECHAKAVGANVPQCNNPACNNRVKRGRNQFCSWECYKIVNDKNAHDTCQREGCCNPLTSRKSTRKYCSQTCYKLDHPNRPSRKKVRLCTLPGCGQQIKRRGNGRKYCSLACSVKARQEVSSVKIKKLDGIPRRFNKVEKKWILTSNITWKESFGEIPKGKQVWFKDNEWFNDMDINNLYLIDNKEYQEIIQKLTHSETKEVFTSGKYEGREETQNTKQEYFDHNQSFF